MMLSLAFVSLLSLLQVSVAWTSKRRTDSLSSAAKAVNIYFGTATDNTELADEAYLGILSDAKMFGQITPGNGLKWDATEPEQNAFDFSRGDQILALAKGNGQFVRGHCLLWYRQLPPWVMYGSWATEALTSVIETHVRTVISHYSGEIPKWDVVNEPLNDDGTMRSNVFSDTLGTSYIGIALEAAHEADPNAKLYINEYNLEREGPKIDEMVRLVEDLLAARKPIHGIGFQCHLILGQVSENELRTNMERFTALGLEVAVTELDVRIPLPASQADLEQQKADYMSVVRACRLAGCAGVTVWDFTDKYSWVTSEFSGYGEACPWDANLNRKPAYEGILEAFLY